MPNSVQNFTNVIQHCLLNNYSINKTININYKSTVADPTLISVWVKGGHRPNLSALLPDTPSELVDIMKRCWNGTPTERPRFQGKYLGLTESLD